MKKEFSRKGFTLIELIIYIGLTAIVVVSLLRVMLVVVGTREKTETISVVQQELRFAMNRMTTTIHDALDIDVPGSVFDLNNGVLSLTMGDPAADPTIFSLLSNRLHIQEGTSVALPLTSTDMIIDQLRFTNLSAPDTYGTVKIVMHATDAVAGSADKTYTDTMTLETSVSLRQ